MEGGYSPAVLHHELVLLDHERQEQIWVPHGVCNEDSTQTGEKSESSANTWSSWRSSKRYILGGEKKWKGHEHSFQISEGLLLHVEGKSYFFCEAWRTELGILHGYYNQEDLNSIKERTVLQGSYGRVCCFVSPRASWPFGKHPGKDILSLSRGLDVWDLTWGLGQPVDPAGFRPRWARGLGRLFPTISFFLCKGLLTVLAQRPQKHVRQYLELQGLPWRGQEITPTCCCTSQNKTCANVIVDSDTHTKKVTF